MNYLAQCLVQGAATVIMNNNKGRTPLSVTGPKPPGQRTAPRTTWRGWPRGGGPGVKETQRTGHQVGSSLDQPRYCLAGGSSIREGSTPGSLSLSTIQLALLKPGGTHPSRTAVWGTPACGHSPRR